MKTSLKWNRQPGSRARKAWFIAAAAAATAVASAATMVGTAVAAPSHTPQAAATAVVAQPKLTTTTPASCNTTPKPGHYQCFAIVHTPADHEIVPDLSSPPASALGPSDIQSAYNLPANAGGGQTIADVIWGDDSTLEADLATFRSHYGLPPCTTANGCFRKVNQDGKQSDYPSDQGTALETSLDVDAYSSACPACNILVVEASSNTFDDLAAAENEAVALGAKFVSNSYGTGDGEAEAPSYNDLDSFYDHPGVVVTASSGDGGWGVSFPASDPKLVSVGGTTLTRDTSTSRGWTETAWGDGKEGAHGDGAGSGCSEYQPQPTWQGGIAALTAVCPSNRGVADVSADADSSSGLAVVDTDPADGVGGWVQVGGTSLAAPLIAGMYALAGTPAPNTYPVSYPYQNASDLNDVISGSNGDCGNVLCNAAAGWDGPTGLGTPNGVQALVGAPQGTITGQVTDAQTGKPIPEARVVASPGSGGVTADTNGDYTLTGLASGTYSLTASAVGYHPATQTGVRVTAGQNTTTNLALVQQGSITGQVTDAATGDPVVGAKLTASPGNVTVTTDVDGDYTVPGLDPGTYSLAISKFTYTDKTVSGVTVADQAVTTENIALARAAITAVSGTVTDGSGHGWPLYAKITVDNDPDGPVFTDPATGKFSISLPQASQTFHVIPLYPGYHAVTQTASLDQNNQALKFAPQIDSSVCTAPGYGPNALTTDLLGWTGGTAQNGWTVTGGKQGWRFDDPGNRQWAPGGDDNFAIADSLYAGNQTINTTLTSPVITLPGQSNPVVSFNTDYVGAEGQSGLVQVSTDHGRHWSTVWHQTDGFVRSEQLDFATETLQFAPIQVSLPVRSGQVQVRFSFTGHDGGYWELDNVLIGSTACAPHPGGLVIGNATDAGTGTDLPGVTVVRATDTAHPAITAATSDDPKVGDGFYWLFAPDGSDGLSASDDGYATANQMVSVKANQVVTHDWALRAN